MDRIALSEINYHEKFYPRQKPSTSTIDEYTEALAAGASFPPIILAEPFTDTGETNGDNASKGSPEEKTYANILLDGYHRWKAYLKYNEGYEKRRAELKEGESIPEPFQFVPVEYQPIPDDVPVKLYAGSLSCKHGLRWSNGDKKATAIEIYKQNEGFPLTRFAQYAGVTRQTAKEYVKDILARFEQTKQAIMLRLEVLGWTHDEISEKLKEMYPEAKGISRVSVTESLSKMSDLTFSTISQDIEKGFSVPDIASAHRLPEILVWAQKLRNLDDQAKLSELGIKIQPYDLWSFQSCHSLFGAEHPGRIPGELVAHVLYFFTETKDGKKPVVIDPMAGSGTVADACLAMNRECYAYDVDARHGRPDIIKHDIAADGWPERTKKADLIFWDPPYFSKMDDQNVKDGYSEKSISKLDRASYLSFFTDSLTSLKETVRRGTRLAFLMSDWNDNAGQDEGIFLWDYADILRDTGWNLVRHIQVPLPTQQVHPDIVNKFRVAKKLARLERYLLIAEA